MKQHAARMATVGLVGAMMMAMPGCAKPPTEQLEAAAKAIETARTAGAPDYAKEDFIKLEQRFAMAKEELAKQEKALSIFRSYTDADKLLKEVVTTGQQVEVLAAQHKEAAKQAALAMEKEAQQVVDSTKALLAQAPTGKERAAVEAMKQDLKGLETGLAATHELIEKGDYLGAEVQAKALKEKGVAVSGEIQSAIEKTRGKKPKAHA
jgi:mannose/fructose/N-acetylgalactosamine-specific phosphotransferase system component IIB